MRLEAAIEEFVPHWSLAPVVPGAPGVAWRRSDRGRDLRHGDRRPSPLREPAPADGLSGPCAPASARPARPSGAGRSPRPATAGCATCWSRAPGPIGIRRRSARQALQAGADLPQGARDRLEGADPAHRALSGPVAQGQENDGRLHRDRPRAGGLHVGHRSRGRATQPAESRADSRRDHPVISTGSGRQSMADSSRTGGGGATAGELPPDTTWPASVDARIKTGQPRTHTRECGSQPAHQSLITDVFGPRLRLCTIHQSTNRRAYTASITCARRA